MSTDAWPAVSAYIDRVCREVRDTASGDIEPLIAQAVRRVAPLATVEERSAIRSGAIARLRGLGELEYLLDDPSIDEVLVNAGNEIWIERAGTLERAGTIGDHNLLHLIERILSPIGRRVDVTTPVVDARLADRSRVCAVVPPIAVDGACLSIRRFAQSPRALIEFTNNTGREICGDLITARANVLIAGATSSGKTSLLASLVETLDADERVVIIEDTAELPVHSGHHVRLECRPDSADGPVAITLPDLVRAALRLRPDRLVVGEVRGDEVVGLLQAFNTGHDGSLTTCHANGPVDALYRLETLTLQASPAWPLGAIRQQLMRSIDAVIYVARRRDGRREIDSISEVRQPPPDDPTPTLAVDPLAVTSNGDLVEAGRPHRTRWATT